MAVSNFALLGLNAGQLFQSARSEIMTELHRGGQQVLSALLLRLGGMGETGSKEDMREIRSLVAKAQTDMRALTQTVVPTALETLGLGAALAHLSKVLDEQGEVSLLVPNDSGHRFDEAVEITAYEVIRGILTRLGHNGLRCASVTLHTHHDVLRIIIEVDIVVSQEMIVASEYCQVLLQQCHASLRSDVGSESTTVVLEFPERSRG
jgi:signal transduction histidine kinase